MSEFQRPLTIAQPEMRSINRSAVLEYLRLAKTASRTELSSQLNISKPTAMRIIDDLLASGLVCSAGKREGGIGRSQNLLTLNTSDNLAIGIDLGGSHMSAAIINIGGEVIYQKRLEETWGSPQENFQKVAGFTQNMLQECSKLPGKLLGVAIGVPGIISSIEGVVTLAPSLAWKNFPLFSKLQPLIPVPLTIENDVNLAALGEHWFGAGVGVDNLVMIAIGTGIGAGIILDGKLYRGHRESSGEIGYLIPGVSFLKNKYPGYGALESLASGKGISEHAQRQWRIENPGKKPPPLTAATVFQSAQAGEDWAKLVIEETVDYLSLAIANVSVCFDPELIILGGGVAHSLTPLIPSIQKRIKNVIPFMPRLVTSSLLSNAPLLGATVRVFQRTAEYATVQMI